jgi:hypothetical protein
MMVPAFLHRTLLSLAVFVCMATIPCPLVQAADPSAAGAVARVTTLSGKVYLHRQPGKESAVTGSRLFVGDVVETGSDGAVGLFFDDDTTISLGPDSRMEIQDFRFHPEAAEFSFVVKLFRGTAVYISGFIAKISSKATRFITPSASIGIRGTMLAIQVDGE